MGGGGGEPIGMAGGYVKNGWDWLPKVTPLTRQFHSFIQSCKARMDLCEFDIAKSINFNCYIVNVVGYLESSPLVEQGESHPSPAIQVIAQLRTGRW